MEQLGKRPGAVARLDTILRHLSPRLGAAPAPVSFPMWAGDRDGAGRWPCRGSACPAPAGVVRRCPLPACSVCVGDEEGSVVVCPARTPCPGGTRGQRPSVVPGLRGGDARGAVPHAAPRRAGRHRGSASRLVLGVSTPKAWCLLPELQPCDLSCVGTCVGTCVG